MKDKIPGYNEIFQRLCGFYYPEQIHVFKKATIGFAGCGVGSNAAYILAKHGIGHLKLADPDVFEATNTNRQVGCRTDTIGLNKANVLKDIFSKINPHSTIEAFPEGITQDNAETFVEGCDVVLDMIDYLANPARLALHKYARKKDIPIILTPVPGNGAVSFVFTKDSMTIEEAFALDEKGNCYDFPRMHKLITGKNFSSAANIFFTTWLNEKNSEDFKEFHLDKPYVSTNPIGGAIGGALAAQLAIGYLLLKTIEKTKKQFTNIANLSIPIMPHYIRLDLNELVNRTGVFDMEGNKVPELQQESLFLNENLILVQGKQGKEQVIANV